MFLAFDVFFAIFCIMLACIIGMALCCCLPCIISFLYTVADHKGASDAELNMLPKFRFRPATRSESTDELALAPEDSVNIPSNFKKHLMDLNLLPHE